MKAPISSAYTGSRAEQVISGAIMIVARRSRGFGDRARGHDAGDRAGEARQQRDERAARQADPAHQPVEQEGGARQVARVLEHEDEEEQDQDLRQEHEHAAGAGDHAVDAAGCAAARRAGARSASRCRAPPRPCLIASIGSFAQENTAWNIRNSTTASSAGPSTGCSTTASMRCWKRRRARGIAAAARGEDAPHLALQSPRCRRRCRGGALDARAARALAPARRAACVERREQRARRRRACTATVSHHRQPELARRARRRRSASRAARRHVGHVQRHHHRAGRGACSSSTRRRFRRRLVASTTQTIRSGGGSPRARPSTTRA